ncbi:MAG: preprotein translocase subunit SecG [Lachnospiraceae bacterium]|nr:preprotein translocase subunit SecG [Lachnospiraceae bacterium]
MSTLKIVITILFIIVSVLISVIILMQQGKDAGLGSLSGQVTDTYWTKNKGRSKEGMMVKVTSALVVLYFIFATVLNIGSF